MCSPIELKSFVDLHLETNSRLLANPDEAAYTESAFRENRGEGHMWIYAREAEQISITGLGTLDGNGVSFMDQEIEDSYTLKPVTYFDPRPHLLTLIKVDRLLIKDVTIKNSAYWTVHVLGCYDVTINAITILNPLKIRNSDGIDVDHSKNVRISDCFIESGDDCICLKNRREYEEYGDCENVVVTNCTMTSRSCAIKFGSENANSIKHVLINNCIIRESNRGIGVQNRDEGSIHDIVFSNIMVDCHFFSDVWWGKSEPIYVTSYPRPIGDWKDANWRFPKGATEGKCGEVYNIHFVNVWGQSENGIFIGGDVEGKVHDITFDNIDLTLEKRTEYKGGLCDRRPCLGDSFIYNGTWGYYIDTASDIRINNSLVRWGKVLPDEAREGIYQNNASVEVR